MNFLEVKNLSVKKEGRDILKDVSVSVPEGKVVALTGPNGAGKSTLSSVVMGLSRFSDFSGKIIFMNELINNDSITQRAKKGISLAFQNPAEFEGISVEKYLSVSSNGVCIRRALKMVGLNPDVYLSRMMDSKLSGGEKKRIELASVYAMAPKLVILDEPDSGVDIESVEFIFKMIDSLKEQGVTVLIVTHSLKILERCDYAFLLCDGVLIDQGNSEKISKYFLNKCLNCKKRRVLK